MGDFKGTHTNHAASRGYTLFELNLSLAILTVAILTSIYMVRNSATFVRASGDLTLASQLVESVMDEAHVSNIYDLVGTSDPRFFNFYGAEIPTVTTVPSMSRRRLGRFGAPISN